MKYQLEIKPKETGFSFSMHWPRDKAISGCDSSLKSIMKSIEGQIRASLNVGPDAEDPADEAFRAAARQEWGKDGEIEIDDNAVISYGDPSGGAYVQAWVWVDKPEGLTEEETEEETEE